MLHACLSFSRQKKHIDLTCDCQLNVSKKMQTMPKTAKFSYTHNYVHNFIKRIYSQQLILWIVY
jgi:hypothetical protein